MPSPKDMIGKPAPKVILPSATEESYTLDPATATKPIVLFFFPHAQTYGCTKEACSFRDALASKPLYSGSSSSSSTDSSGAGVQIVGVSSDPVAKQKAFVEQHNLTYPVLCDVNGEAIKAYNVTRGLLGISPGRTTFIIDGGTVQDVYDSVLNFHAHEKFVTKWLEKRAGVNPPEPQEEPPTESAASPAEDPGTA